MFVDLSLPLQDKPNLVVVDDLFSISNLVIRIIAFLFIADISLQFSSFDVALSRFCIRVLLNLSKTFGLLCFFFLFLSSFLFFLSFFLSSFLLLNHLRILVIRHSENSNGYKDCEMLERKKG